MPPYETEIITGGRIMKRLLSFTLALALLFTFCAPALAVEEPLLLVTVGGTLDDQVMFGASETIILDWQFWLDDGVEIYLQYTQGIRLAYDKTVLQLIRWDAAAAIDDSAWSTSFTNCSNVASPESEYPYNLRVAAARNAAGDVGYLNLTLGDPEEVFNPMWFMPYSLMQVRFAFRPGKSVDDLNAESIRCMTVDELDMTAQSSAVLLMTSEGTAYRYLYQNGGVLIGGDLLNAPEFIYPNCDVAGSSFTLNVTPTSWNPSAGGDNTTITVTSNVSWTAISNAAWLTVSPISGSNDGSLTLTAQTNSSTSSRTGMITVAGEDITRTIMVEQAGEIPPTPVITIGTQPASATVTQGSISGSLSVAASVTQGATLSYQWYSNTTNSNTGGAMINGATAASYTIPTTLTAGAYYYYCVVGATGGAASVTSNAATVTVNAPATVGDTYAGISAPTVWNTDEGVRLSYDISVGQVDGAQIIDVKAQFDSAKLTYVGSMVNIDTDLSLLNAQFDETTGEYKATLAFLKANAVFAAEDLTKILNIAFESDPAYIPVYKDVIVGTLISVVLEKPDFTAYSCQLLPPSVETAVDNHMRWDVDGDGILSLMDLAYIINHYYLARAGDNGWAEAKLFDANDDGIIDLLDILTILSYCV